MDGMGGIMSAGFAPLITVEERADWEAYSVENQGWITESQYLKEVHPVHRDALHGTIQDHEHDRRRLQGTDEGTSISPELFHWEDGVKVVEPSSPGRIYAPLWQVSPADPVAVNADLLADERIAELYDVMNRVGHGVVSSNTEIGDLVSSTERHLYRLIGSCLNTFHPESLTFCLMIQKRTRKQPRMLSFSCPFMKLL